VPVNNPWSHSW